MSEEKENPIENEESENEMTLFEHLEELRFVILKSLGALIVGCLFAALGYIWIADILRYPLEQAIQAAGEAPVRAELIGRGVFDSFNILFRVMFIGGMILALPFVFYFIIDFISPGLTNKERSILAPSCLASGFLFVAGASFCYFFILPSAIKVSFFFFGQFGITPQFDATRYYGLVIWTMVGVGLCFEFPLVLIVAQYLELISPQALAKNWRYAAAITVVLSAVIVPGGDPLTLMIMALPLFVLYLLSIVVGRWLLGKKESPLDE